MLRWIAAALAFAVLPTPHAAPITPTRDDEVIEILPAVTGNRAEARRLRQQLAGNPRDPALALAVAKRYFEQAHELGDPRFAGMALSVVAPWQDEATTPDELLLMRASLQTYFL